MTKTTTTSPPDNGPSKSISVVDVDVAREGNAHEQRQPRSHYTRDRARTYSKLQEVQNKPSMYFHHTLFLLILTQQERKAYF